MKKKNWAIMLFVFIAFFITLNRVKAATIIATCEYNVPYTSESYMKFKIFINDDNTAESYYHASDIEDFKSTNNAKMLLMPTIFSSVGNADSYATDIASSITNKSIIQAYEGKGNTCPNIITSINGSSTSVMVSSDAAVDGINTILASITKEEYSSEGPSQVTQTKNCVSHYDKGNMTGVAGAEFHFNQYSDGKREFCVKTIDMVLPSCTSFNENNQPALTVITNAGAAMTFTISNETLADFYTDTCVGKDFFVYEEAGIGAGSYVLTTSEDEANQGTAVTPGEEGELNPGVEIKFSPTKLCKDSNNCDISLTGFCALPTISRTLKFVGLLFSLAKILVPAIIIIMGIVNLIKIITSGKDDEVKKGVKNIATRILIGVVIFLLPSVIKWIFTIADDIVTQDEPSEILNCVYCVLDKDECVVTEKN